MKRNLLAALSMVLVIAMAGCGDAGGQGKGGNSDQRSLAEIIAVYQDNGVEVDESEKPQFQLIDADDAVIFYMNDNNPVKIYMYESEKALNAEKKDNQLISDWKSNGRFLLETYSEEAEAIFESIKSDGSSSYKEEKEAADAAKRKPVAVGETIIDERAEVTIKNIEFSYDVLPDSTSYLYSHYPAESGKVYIHIDTDIKNIQKQDLTCDDVMSVEVDYNDGYKYSGFSVAEDQSLGFNYSEITSIQPLASLGVRYLVECPQEVADSQNPVKVKFYLGDQEYQYAMR